VFLWDSPSARASAKDWFSAKALFQLAGRRLCHLLSAMKISEFKLSGFSSAKAALAALYSSMALPDRQKILCSAPSNAGRRPELDPLLDLTLRRPEALAPVYENAPAGTYSVDIPGRLNRFSAWGGGDDRVILEASVAPWAVRCPVGEGRATAGVVHRDKFSAIHDKISAIRPIWAI
jgi:hypothetical protein